MGGRKAHKVTFGGANHLATYQSLRVVSVKQSRKSAHFSGRTTHQQGNIGG
jgi:hypothetical protein